MTDCGRFEKYNFGRSLINEDLEYTLVVRMIYFATETKVANRPTTFVRRFARITPSQLIRERE